LPTTVAVSAFVFGIVFILAALVGKEIEVVAIKLPALRKPTRVILGLAGAALLYLGIFDPIHQPVALAPNLPQIRRFVVRYLVVYETSAKTKYHH
jgi:hypothetical protein